MTDRTDETSILTNAKSPEEMSQIVRQDYLKINQRELQKHVNELG